MSEETPLVRRAVRPGGVLLAVAAGQFLAVLAWVASRTTNFALGTTTVTSLVGAAGPWGPLVSASAIALGALGAAGLLFSWSAFDDRRSRGIGLLVLFVAAVSVAALGAFGLLGSRLPADALRIASYVAAGAAGVGLVVVATAMHRDERWHVSRVYTLVSGAVVLVGTALAASPWPHGLSAGGLQQAVVAAAVVWALVEGLHIALLHRFAPGLQVKIASA